MLSSADLGGRVCGDGADDLQGGGGGVVAVGVPGSHQGGVCRYNISQFRYPAHFVLNISD